MLLQICILTGFVLSNHRIIKFGEKSFFQEINSHDIGYVIQSAIG